ncbi:MAG: ABC transporter substrate-binding protein [Deltaproteobacteria bacterium]|nr:ABC transporter substrate-binding protein [Deltaproteobacteria bacterium]
MTILPGALVACLFLAACQPPPPAKSSGRRIVSLDYCADQFVLGLADRADILAVSPDAGAAFSYMRAAADGLPRVRPRAEDVLALKPGLVVRSYGGGPNARTFFERAGVPVLQIPFADDIAGARAVIRHAARGLGLPERGEALIAGMDARLRAARMPGPEAHALYMTPAGYSAGPGTLVHDVLTAAGLDNFQSRSGWQPIPLEALAYDTPALVARADFGEGTNHDDAWTSFRHPVVRRTLRAVPLAALDGATTSCGGWFVADAVAALATLRRGASTRAEP